MNRINEMNAQELQDEVIEKLGYCMDSQGIWYKHDKNYKDMPLSKGQFFGSYYNIPYYPSDIAAAWELVEEMKNNKCYVYLNYHPTPKWECKIKDTDSFDYGWHEGTADTAPIAICRAWLKWKRGKNE